MTTDDATVRLPPDLRAECESRIEGTNFDSVEEYVQFVVAEVVDADVDRDGVTAGSDESKGSRDESDAVTERLEGLGYL